LNLKENILRTFNVIERKNAMTIFSVGAHMDDSENGIGVIIVQAVRDGHRVVCVVATGDYTSWAYTVGREEAVKKQQLELPARFGYEKRFLNYKYHQVEADVAFKKQIIEIYVEIKPDITFAHTTSDHWPDHVACGTGTKDAVLFSHGLTSDLSERRCPRIFAYSVTAGQTITFEPDHFVNVSDVMPEYMEMLQHTDSCLSGKPPEDVLQYEVKELASGKTLKMSGHGWRRHGLCSVWGDASGERPYAIGLQSLWGPKGGKLW